MSLCSSPRHLQNLLVYSALLCGVTPAVFAQTDYTLPNVPYVCNGERLVIESCNIRDTSPTSTCMVGHPDHVLPNGLMQYTTMTRAAIRQLFPTCKQPTPQQVARAQAFQKRQQDLYDANVKKANDENDAIEARAQAAMSGRKPMKPEERAMNRCITSGRLPSSCTGNALLGAFGQMLASVLPSSGEQQAQAGPTMAGVFEGAGGWRLDFIDGGVLVNCSFLSPNQEAYSLSLTGAHPVITVKTRPRALVLTLHDDGTIAGPGPVTLDGVVAGAGGGGGLSGSNTGNYKDENGMYMSDQSAANYSGQLYNAGGMRVNHPTAGGGGPSFLPRRVTCPALRLSSKNASVGLQTMQTDLLKGMFGGDKGPPTPAGIRMHGIYAAPTGFSVQFFPESAVLGCGPDAARAYPYSVVAEGSRAVVKIAAADHPLSLSLRADNTLDAGTGAYQVHGRTIVGQDNDDNFTFAPLEQSCNLAVLSPAKEIPATGGLTAAGAANTALPRAASGNASLTILSGFPATAGTANPLAGHPYTLLRDRLENIVSRAGVAVAPGTSAYKTLAQACGGRTPDCAKIVSAIQANAAFAVRADANGRANLSGMAPGTYYLMISTRYGNEALVWSQAVEVQPGANSLTLDRSNATPMQ